VLEEGLPPRPPRRKIPNAIGHLDVHAAGEVFHRPHEDGVNRVRVFERAASIESLWEDAVHSLRGSPNVIDLRNIGIVGAIELEPRPGAPGARGFETFVKCFEAGVLVRSTADTIALSPPLIVERDQITQMFEVVRGVLRNVA